MNTDTNNTTNEVARLREENANLKGTIRAIIENRRLHAKSFSESADDFEEMLNGLAPAPEEAVSRCDHNPNGKCADCWPIKEPVPEWRELGPDEEICEEDEGNEKGTDVWFTAGCAFWGMKPHPQGSYRFRTRRPLPKREEMPLEDDDQIERLFKDEVDLIEKWGCSKDPIRSPHAQEAFVHVIHSLRCLDNEIQQHEHMFTTWINATVDHRREIRYLRDEIQKLKEAKP